MLRSSFHPETLHAAIFLTQQLLRARFKNLTRQSSCSLPQRINNAAIFDDVNTSESRAVLSCLTLQFLFNQFLDFVKVDHKCPGMKYTFKRRTLSVIYRVSRLRRPRYRGQTFIESTFFFGGQAASRVALALPKSRQLTKQHVAAVSSGCGLCGFSRYIITNI